MGLAALHRAQTFQRPSSTPSGAFLPRGSQCWREGTALSSAPVHRRLVHFSLPPSAYRFTSSQQLGFAVSCMGATVRGLQSCTGGLVTAVSDLPLPDSPGRKLLQQGRSVTLDLRSLPVCSAGEVRGSETPAPKLNSKSRPKTWHSALQLAARLSWSGTGSVRQPSSLHLLESIVLQVAEPTVPSQAS